MKKIDLKDEKTRTMVLGGAAALMGLILLVKSMTGGAPEEPSAAVKDHPKKSASPETKIAVIDHDRKLRTIYQPILDVEPFRAHLFTKRHSGSGPIAPITSSNQTARSPSDGPPAGSTTMRLTGIFAVDTSGLTGFLENRGAGKGIYVHRGDALGPRSVAEVRTDSILFSTVAVTVTGSIASTTTASSIAPVESTILVLGDAVYVPTKDIERIWANIGPVMSTSLTPPVAPVNNNSWAGPKTVPLTDEERDSVLTRLKKKRQASLGGEAPK